MSRNYGDVFSVLSFVIFIICINETNNFIYICPAAAREIKIKAGGRPSVGPSFPSPRARRRLLRVRVAARMPWPSDAVAPWGMG